jgi:hypothetical protein
MDFGSDEEMRKIPDLAHEFFVHVLRDEYEPIHVGDEATIWDVSTATPEELLQRCSEHYGTSVSLEDLRQPLCKLLPRLSAGRQNPESPQTHR